MNLCGTYLTDAQFYDGFFTCGVDPDSLGVKLAGAVSDVTASEEGVVGSVGRDGAHSADLEDGAAERLDLCRG